jgi:hypothetical protein
MATRCACLSREGVKLKGITCFLLGAVLSCVSATSFADGWTPGFTITSLYVSGPNNFEYRINGMPAQSQCPNATSWAYINETDPGAQWYAAALLSAYTAGKTVQLYIQPVNGFCHILEMVVSG